MTPREAPPSSPPSGGPSASGASSTPNSAPTFEDAVKRLGEIVQSLERGELPLEESLRLFEEGVRLSRVSQEKLDAAQKKVELLLGVDEQGRPRTQAFDSGED